jgi:D-alanyl-D-alanine carboxypeptidase (penicillin-binding protein 5/6)
MLITLIMIGTLGFYAYASPIPNVSPTTATIDSNGTSVNIPWPTYGQSALGAMGYGLLASSGNKPAVPTASIAKVMTALTILKIKPLTVNDQGPTITMTANDAVLYNSYVAKNGSVVPVADGEQITERQALEAMLLPSANNVADSLADWAFGSVKNYADYANTYAKQLGLNNTVITSSSGYPPETVSTAQDLVKLGVIAMNNQVIANIVSLPTADVPVAGTIRNVNFLLGSNNIIGVKTGDTDQAGGCYLFASKRQLASGQTITLIGAIMGAHTLAQAMQDSLRLINAGYQNFAVRRIVNQGDTLGYYNLPWGGRAVAKAANNIDVFSWKDKQIKAAINLNNLKIGYKAGSQVGKVQTDNQSAVLLLNSDIVAPSHSWRLFRWFK